MIINRIANSTYFLAGFCVFFLCNTPLSANTISGSAEVIDGDSLKVAGQEVRLIGIDAPEYDQSCNRNGQSWACGQEAISQLTSLVEGQSVECTGAGHDVHNRLLAVCSVGYHELNRTLVEYGWAVAYRTYSDAYVGEEVRAKAEKRGIWSSEMINPAEYRRSRSLPSPGLSQAMTNPARVRHQPARGRAQPQYSSPQCNIKGNHSRRGEWIYHLPGMKYYDATRAEEYFCSEKDALRAGYRRARTR
ncbi:MAG: thermonuclease family protein [Sphingomonadaceae bacterium]